MECFEKEAIVEACSLPHCIMQELTSRDAELRLLREQGQEQSRRAVDAADRDQVL